MAKLGLKMTDEQITDMIKIADKDGDGNIGFEVRAVVYVDVAKHGPR